MRCLQATILLTTVALSVAVAIRDNDSVSRLMPSLFTHIAQEPTQPFLHVDSDHLERSFRQSSSEDEAGGDSSPSDVSSSEGSEESEDSSETSQSPGLTLELCRVDSNCLTPRVCIDDSALPPRKCTGGVCRCVPLAGARCNSDANCVEGEGCFEASDFINVAGIPDVKICASRAVHAELSAMVCIAAHSLDHIPKENLVFEKHVVAHVLCDASYSCATPGHIVHYKGRTMMMKSYCELAGCESKDNEGEQSSVSSWYEDSFADN